MENKKSEKKNGKKIAIIVIIAVLLAAAVILCVLLPTSPANPDESAAPTESADPASPDSSKPGSTKPDTKPNASASPEVSAAPAEIAAPAQPGNTGSTNINQNPGSGSQTVPGQPGDSTGNQSNTNTGNQNSGTQTGANTGNTEHQHNWQPVYKTVHHDEKGHYETVVVQAAWDEEKLRYTDVCNVCGYQGSNVADHIWDAHDGAGSYHNEGFPTGEYIHHDEVTELRWIVDTPAYDEQVVAGYKCSCGQEKLA